MEPAFAPQPLPPQVIEVKAIDPTPVPHASEVMTMEPAPAPQVIEAITVEPESEVSEAMTTEPATAPPTTPEPEVTTTTPVPVRRPKPIRILPPIDLSRRISRYRTPKPSAYPTIATTPASSNIFSPPLSTSVRAGSRVRISSSHETSRNEVTQDRAPIVSIPFKAEVATSKYPRHNYGAADIRYAGGAVVITEIGTIEDTPLDEVQRILSGFGSRRRGLGRPQEKRTVQKPPPPEPVSEAKAPPESTSYDYTDYYYDDLY